MRAVRSRWGEVCIRRCEEGGKIDKSMSFSIEETPHVYDLLELKEILETVVNLTQKFKYSDLANKLGKI